MPKQRISSRLANKQKKDITKQSILFLILSILVGVIFLVLILPNAVRLFFEVLDKQTVIEKGLDLPPQTPVMMMAPEFTNESTLLLSGYAQSQSTVIILLNFQNEAEIEIDDQGQFEQSITLSEGENNISLYAINDNEIESQSASYTITLDTQPPPIKLGAPENDQRFELKENQTISVEGETEPKAKVFINGRSTTANPEGLFNYRLYLSEGENNIEIRAVDQAGNESETQLTVYYRD